MSVLFSAFSVKGVTFKNRIVMSPMCQYSVEDASGKPGPWHFTHYVSRAVGGAGLIMLEMTDVHPDGRITVRDLGLWDDRQIDPFARLVDQIHQAGAKAGIQLAHAGRKAQSPELALVAPSALPYSERYRVPRALATDEVAGLVDAFAASARRAVAAGFDVIELHGAHGYLVHQFMSPASNHRQDKYGEPTRFPVEVLTAMKAAMPADMPLFMRISATEHDSRGYSFEQLLEMARAFRQAGADLFDVSSGGNLLVTYEEYPGYHVRYAARIREELGVPVSVVGKLESPMLAESVLQQGQADLIAIGRGMLRDPYWALSAARELRERVEVPEQYRRAYSDR